jgi:predicted ATPase
MDLPLEPLNVFIGPNGSGKPDLLQVPALLKITVGAVAIDFLAPGNGRACSRKSYQTWNGMRKPARLSSPSPHQGN